MKILIIINALTIGGAERQAVTDANILYERGHNVTVAFNKTGPLNINYCIQPSNDIKSDTNI